MNIDYSIDTLPNTSIQTIRKLKSLDINSYFDLLNYFPFRFEDYSRISPISQLQTGEIITLKGQIISLKNEITKRGFKIQKALIDDNSGKIEIVWFNQPYLMRLLRPGQNISVSGEVKQYLNKFTIDPKEYEVLTSASQICVHTARILPIYPEKRGLSSKILRNKIHKLLDKIQEIPELLPEEVIAYNNLIRESEAYYNIHFPKDKNLLQKAKSRLSFDELFIIQLSAALIKKEWEKKTVGNAFKTEAHHDASLRKFIKNLPFDLTSAQKRSIDEILKDLTQTIPMNRFLQGDVGSGKTAVAAVGAYLTCLNGFKTLFMAPTEILADQHFQTLKNLFKNTNVKIGIQTGSKKMQHTPTYYNIIIGTHALFNEKLNFKKVGLVIIDEQHRFGVVQRTLLRKKGVNTHLLTMTATPIPRTIALTLYGELSLSIIDEMPKGRLPVKTFSVPVTKREAGYQWIKNQIKAQKSQVFIVCPLIEESEIETMKSIKAATLEYENLKNNVFKELKLGLLHGKIKSFDKEQIMKDFKDKKIDILIATSVVEVGIDIPNATIIVIEAAERFGLAQLHQLRGRVGRSDKQSYCLLFTDSTDQKILERLRFFAKNHDGMKIAEYDLKIRGVGEVYGVKQHGIANLKIASFSDFNLIKQTKNAVNYFINKYDNVSQFQELQKRLEKYRINLISRD